MPADRPAAVITGAARGICAHAALQLAREGWDVALVDGCRDDPALPYALGTREDLRAAEAACRAEGADTLGLEADVRDAAAVQAAVSSAVERFGRLDAAVAGAGAIAGGTPGWATADATWDVMFAVNFDGVRTLAEAAVPLLLAAPAPRHGRFVAIASSAGTLGLRGLGAYAAAKHAVIGYVRALAADLEDTGVTANAVAPGSTRTAMLEASARIYDLAGVDELGVHHAFGRVLEPQEPAAAVAWLCSPASSGMTGSVVAVDGGMTGVR